tara:strand:- start:1476 stop:1952 length:477 start_codon:yes stop_codon:yes gene_type:complete
MSKDIGIYESGSGGDLSQINKNLILSDSLLQNIYLSLFGGNIEASTERVEFGSKNENLDYWANSLIYRNKRSKQFNSRTEKVLSETALNSAGRLKIERVVKQDLKTLSDSIGLDINVSIPENDQVKISVRIISSESNQGKEYHFIWQPREINIIDFEI